MLGVPDLIGKLGDTFSLVRVGGHCSCGHELVAGLDLVPSHDGGAVEVKSEQGIGGRVERDVNLEILKAVEWIAEGDTVLFPHDAIIYEATHVIRHSVVAQ